MLTLVSVFSREVMAAGNCRSAGPESASRWPIRPFVLFRVAERSVSAYFFDAETQLLIWSRPNRRNGD